MSFARKAAASIFDLLDRDSTSQQYNFEFSPIGFQNLRIGRADHGGSLPPFCFAAVAAALETGTYGLRLLVNMEIRTREQAAHFLLLGWRWAIIFAASIPMNARDSEAQAVLPGLAVAQEQNGTTTLNL
jgi:hypothetical protein